MSPEGGCRSAPADTACLAMRQLDNQVPTATAAMATGSVHLYSLCVGCVYLADHLVQGHQLAALHVLGEAVVCGRTEGQHHDMCTQVAAGCQ